MRIVPQSVTFFEPMRRWDNLSTRLNKLHNQTQEAAANAIDCARAAGELLIEAKKSVGHGNWLPWLSNNVVFSAKTATNYMRVARVLPKLPAEDRQRVADLSFRDYLGSLSTDTGRLARLEAPNADGVLSAAEQVPLKKALSRAVTAACIRHEQDHPVVREPVPESSPRQVPLWRSALRDRILELVRAEMLERGISATDAVEALNDAYTELLEGVVHG